MHEQVRANLTKAICQSLPVAQELATRLVELHLVWHRSGDRQWNGAYEQRPSMAAIFIEGRKDFEKIGSEFRDNFAHHHPEYGGMVGFPGMRMRFFHDPTHVLGLALFTLWDGYGSFLVVTEVVRFFVKEFAKFVILLA